ncbi:hypothetical protein INT45_013247 [Circinella minor]|uniref:Uncharacterized protein n=1 Tax=Circinella minor TaxID=1195481 RepID=A0A8H7S5G0_9FUNG|nr:hypothetical protein INT45_013247 [Circinella minor]
MLTLGQASCLVLGYKPNDENRKKAKEHLQGSGLVAFYFRGQDPMRPAAIGSDVLERDPYTFLTYPPTPSLAPTTPSNNDDIDDDDGSQHNNNDNNNNNNNNNNNSDLSQKTKDTPSDSTDSPKAPHNRKRKIEDSVIPYCKERVLQTMKTIATNVNPNNEPIFDYVFVTSEMQYNMMTEIFPSLSRHCSKTRLQYWVSQSQIWGPLQKINRDKKLIYGRYLWVLRNDMWHQLIEINDSIPVYWQHANATPHIISIGYARKSVTNETDLSRKHLLQLMVDKLHFRLKCQEVYVSPCCTANDQILNRDSPPFTNILASLNGCHGDISNLINRLHYLQQEVRLCIIDYAGLSTYPEDIIDFLTTYPNISEIAIDHGGHIEILSRHQLLKNNQVQKFNCRPGPVKRST